MTEARHAAARHAERVSWRQIAAQCTLPVLGFGTLVATGVGAAVATDVVEAPVAPEGTDVIAAAFEAEVPRVSRGDERPPLTDESAAAELVDGSLYVLENGVQVHADAAKDSPVLAKKDLGDQVAVTGEKRDGWTQIIHKDLPRWVRSKDLGKELPIGTAPCAYGSERGLQPDTIKVHRAVCALFPSITRYGGLAGRGEHATGHSLDIMVSSDLGNEIAAYLQEHRAELGVEYLIWRQRIWRPATSGAWRPMSDRGGATANHYDHVHVTTYGNAATLG